MKGIEEALLSICIDTGEILDCNEAAVKLLTVPAAEMVGEPWRQMIPCDANSASALEHALQAGRRVMLPPLILGRHQQAETVVGGLCLPVVQDQQHSTAQLLTDVAVSG